MSAILVVAVDTALIPVFVAGIHLFIWCFIDTVLLLVGVIQLYFTMDMLELLMIAVYKMVICGEWHSDTFTSGIVYISLNHYNSKLMQVLEFIGVQQINLLYSSTILEFLRLVFG